ncbi:bifunctional arginine demethylase and lysyl-hydroxylase PSR-like [Branchiostoma lanceolatum]|uniref:bifunctional arginine demethylase and lysyl-hydroxylase PSR-like n=1 Tax=Branchiostoma lanceolatum TaxID=7740 RepID=UPI003451CA9B
MSQPVNSDCEKISEWPPRDTGKGSSSDESEDEESVRHICEEKEEGRRQKYIRQVSLPGAGPNKKRAKLCESDEDFWEDPEPAAQASLARWWRREGINTVQETLPNSSNPNTRLLHVARTKEARIFLKSEICRLKHKLMTTTGLEKAGILSALASYYDMMGEYQDAETCLHKSLSLNSSSKHTQWLLAKVKKQLDAISIQTAVTKNLAGKEKEDLSFPSPMTVERVSGNSMSADKFFKKYSSTSTPVVITDVVEDMTHSQWTIEYLRAMIGHKEASVKHVVHGSAEWAQLETARTMKVSDFIDSLDEHNTQKLYLFDWSLPIHCTELSKELTVPKYFCHDFLKKTREGSLYRDSWPSLFVAPSGLSGGLHVDAFGSNFWMALFQGRKRWLFFQKEDLPLLYPCYNHSTDPTFDVDVFNPDVQKYPLLSQTHPRECILQPGELLFVPAGCPHRVENLDKSLAVSGNFVDESNIQVVKQELRINALKDPRALDLLQQFSDSDSLTKIP